MVSSLSKKWSSVVRLLRLVNPKASDLLSITVQVIKDIEQLGLFVDIIVSNNYPLNVNLFKLLGNSKELLSCVLHPNDNQRSLYLMFDLVHIVNRLLPKCNDRNKKLKGPFSLRKLTNFTRKLANFGTFFKLKML